MEDGVECRDPASEHRASVDDEHPRCSGDCEAISAITVEDESGHTVEDPAVALTAGGDPVPDRGAGLGRVVVVPGQGRELGE